MAHPVHVAAMHANLTDTELVRAAKTGDLTEANVKMRLLRARLQLREQLTRVLSDPAKRIQPGQHQHE